MSRPYSVSDRRQRHVIQDPKAVAALRQISRHPWAYGLPSHPVGSSRFTLGEVRTALGHVGSRSRWRPEMAALLAEVSGAYYHGAGARMRTTRIGSALWAEARAIDAGPVDRAVRQMQVGDVVDAFSDLREAYSCRGQRPLDPTTRARIMEGVQAALAFFENPPRDLPRHLQNDPAAFHRQFEALRVGTRDFGISFPQDRALHAMEMQMDRYVSETLRLVRGDISPVPYSQYDLIESQYLLAVQFSHCTGVPIPPEAQRDVMNHQFSRYLQAITYFSSEERLAPDVVEAVMARLLSFMRQTNTLLPPSAQRQLTQRVNGLERYVDSRNDAEALSRIRFMLSSIVS